VRRTTPLAAGLLLLLSPALLLTVPARATTVRVLVADGRGHGHGVGMAQDGAYWMARDGASLSQILGHFYPGTAPGTSSGTVRVVVLTAPEAGALIGFPTGGDLRSPEAGPQHPGFPVKVSPGGAVVVRIAGGRYHVEPTGTGAGGASAASAASAASTPAQIPPIDPSTTTTIAPPGGTTTTTAPGSSTTSTTAPGAAPPPPPAGGPPSSPEPVWAVPADFGTIAVPAREARYRGVMEVNASGPDGPLRLLNRVHVEDYLRGMGEVRDPSWPQAALQTQAVAARTYALRAMAVSGELCDTQRCQVYLGQQAEYGAMDEAVRATAGMVITYGRRLASAVYSASGGGVSATPEEGFGTPSEGYPYLRAAPYPTPDPRPWTAEVALTDVAARLGYLGTLTGVEVASTGPSNRPLQVRLEGDAGERTELGVTFARALGFRSTLYTLRVSEADEPPAPPPAPGESALTQVTPEHAGAATRGGTDESADGWRRGKRGPTPDERQREAALGESSRRQDPSADGHWPLAATIAAAILAIGLYGALSLRREEAGPNGPAPSTSTTTDEP
jgi:stage II sporulation protein D